MSTEASLRPNINEGNTAGSRYGLVSCELYFAPKVKIHRQLWRYTGKDSNDRVILRLVDFDVCHC